MSRLEHVNITVADPAATAAWLGEVFGFQVRWQGESKFGGFTVHVGETDTYIAVYSPPDSSAPGGDSYHTRAGLNHVGIVVDDLDATEARVKNAGFKPHSHADYEPGRRFYIHDGDGIEWEVVCYD